tara:strand:- start:2273 stop:2434 length:162 start_codon:yes stop_codon:yes gene_type:complete
MTYKKQALDLLSKDHPHYEEVKTLLLSQINDEIHDWNHTIKDRRPDGSGERTD